MRADRDSNAAKGRPPAKTRPSGRLYFILLPALFALSIATGSVTSRPAACMLGDCRNGRGRLVIENRFEYSGEFRDGLFYGEGELRFADGGRYRGAFRNDRFEGLGLLEFASGARYAGEFARGRFAGAGTYVFASGARYEGEFFEGRMHGSGRFEGGDGSLYEGDFRAGRKHGHGVLYLPDGVRRAGVFIRDRFAGPQKSTREQTQNQTRTKMAGRKLPRAGSAQP